MTGLIDFQGLEEHFDWQDNILRKNPELALRLNNYAYSRIHSEDFVNASMLRKAYTRFMLLFTQKSADRIYAQLNQPEEQA